MDLKSHPAIVPLYAPGHHGSASDMTYYAAQANYMKNSRAIGVLWGVFTMCFAIINVVVFVQPQWLGDTETSKGTGYFGLWKSCRLLQDGQDLMCNGRLDDFGAIPSTAFRAATVFMAISVVLVSLCLITMILFIFLHSSTVFNICAWLQTSCATCMLVSVLLFPLGWDSPQVREVCGADSGAYAPGQCSLRWAYILALIGTIDCGVLSVLAFVLGSRYISSLPERYIPTGSIYGRGLGAGELNGAFMADSVSLGGGMHHMVGNGGRGMVKGGPMPVMVLPNGDYLDTSGGGQYSDHYSHRSIKSNGHGVGGGGRRESGSANVNPSQFSINNFQL